MDTCQPLMSQGEYARHRNCSEPYISQLAREGRLVRDADGLVDAAATDAYLDATTDPAKIKRGGARAGAGRKPKYAHLGPETGPGVSFAEAKRREMVIRAKSAQLDHEQKAGNLVWREDVERETYARARTLSGALLAIPDRVASILAAEEDARAVYKMLKNEILGVLNAQADDAEESV